MNKSELKTQLDLLDRTAREIQEVLQLRKDQSSSIALQELKTVLNDSEKEDLTTPFNIDPRSIDILLGEYQKGIDRLQKKYISSGSFENMMERIFNIGEDKMEVAEMLEKEMFLQENLMRETEQLEDTLRSKKEEAQEILETIRSKNRENFNDKETEIQDMMVNIHELLLQRGQIEDMFGGRDEQDKSVMCDVFDEEFMTVLDAALEE